MFGRSVYRLFHTTVVGHKVDKNLLSKLRKRTGFPFVKCKNALQKFEGDFAKAEEWLKQKAQEEGWDRATKLGERPMSQGLISVIVEGNNATMVEVNCETDFVARNNKFHGLVSKVTHACMDWAKERPENKIFMIGETVKVLPAAEGKTIADLMALEIGNLGENMAVRRAIHYKSIGDDAHIGSYVHAVGKGTESPQNRCTFGKFGALVMFRQQSEPTEKTDATQKDDLLMTPARLGRQLGQHVVGMNPMNIAPDEGTKKGDPSEEESLIKQSFLMDEDVTVEELLDMNKASVQDFSRFGCGEELLSDNVPDEVYKSYAEGSNE